jgi:hypothetical protein
LDARSEPDPISPSSVQTKEEVRSPKSMEPALTRLAIRWLVLVLSYFLGFIVFFGVFLVHVDFYVTLQGAIVFSSFVGTVGSAFMWLRNEDQPTYATLATSSGVAVLAFVGLLVLHDTAKDFWTPSVLILFLVGMVVGILAKRLYRFLMNQIGNPSAV